MSGTPYQQGNPVKLAVDFLDGTMLADPADMFFAVRDPGGVLTTYVYLTDPEVTKLADGVYECALGVPADAGQYHYEAVALDGDGDRIVTLPGEFYVIPSSVDVPVAPPGPVLGPCRTWINGEDLVNCPGIDLETQAQLADAVAVEASMLMYEISGRQFAGLCERTVRPCGVGCNGWPYNWDAGVYSWWGWGGGGWGWYGAGLAGFGYGAEQGPQCGCQPLSRVKLGGYPVREIVEVKIDGVVLDELDINGNPNYRLDGWQWLTRMADPTTDPVTLRRWPACQDEALDATEPGTFQVTYRYGVDPPPLGVEAAKAFACELFASQTGGECKLPANVTKTIRQGLTQERITPLAEMLLAGATGIDAVNAFIAAYNPSGLRRRPAVWSPDTPRYAPRLGSV